MPWRQFWHGAAAVLCARQLSCLPGAWLGLTSQPSAFGQAAASGDQQPPDHQDKADELTAQAGHA